MKDDLLKNIENSKINELSSLYVLLTDICSDYSRMTDGYSIATGDNKFENLPDGIRTMIEERQQFFNYRNIIKEHVKNEIRKIMENVV